VDDSATSTITNLPSNMATLPPHVWAKIIYIATRLPDWCHPLTSTSVTPFLVSPEDNLTAHKATLQTRAHIVLVSRQWNTVGTTFLYEFIQLSRSSTFAALSSSLERQESEVKRGSLVRAAIISYEPVVHFPHSVILTQLPNLQVIIHTEWYTSSPPDYDHTFEIDRLLSSLPEPELPTLQSVHGNVKRIECYEHVNSDADISLTNLRQSLWMCRNIQCLSVRGYPIYIPTSLPFESLDTLRIDPHPNITQCQLPRHQIIPWSMPNLRNVVMHIQCMGPLCDRVFSQFGENLHTVELTISSETLPQHDGSELSKIIKYCPRLQELSYHIEVCRSPAFPHGPYGPHMSLVRLRLYAGYAALPEHKLSNTASSHFFAYTSRTVPNLKQVFCYGKWKGRIPRIQDILETFAFEWDRGGSSDTSVRSPVIEFV